jgi:hypothetical protein
MYNQKKTQDKKMKKLSILTLGLFFAAGSAFAQSNDATVDQTGDYHEASIEQSGELNFATVTQGNGYNEVVLSQESNAAGSSSATITQDVSATSSANRGQEVKLDQVGYNLANITQGAAGNKVLNYTEDGAATQTSVGGLNTLTVTQNTAWSRVFVDQMEGGNTATVSQFGGNGFVASILQNSENNTATVSQTGSSSEIDIQQNDSGNHTATVTQGFNFQDGTNNGTVVQNGLSQTSTLTQYGDGNLSTITQSGELNVAIVLQDGMSNTATATQSGVSNTATITQN